MATEELQFECGHRNYGTEEHPASVNEPGGEYECATCSKYYCDRCNYDRHTCPGCGEELNHRTAIEHFKTDCTA